MTRSPEELAVARLQRQLDEMRGRLVGERRRSMDFEQEAAMLRASLRAALRYLDELLAGGASPEVCSEANNFLDLHKERES